MLYAYVDDSGTHANGPAIVVLAGFLSTPDRWAAFTTEWNRECGENPPTPDFHMSDAWNVYGPYWGYEEDATLEGDELARRRDARITALIEIVQRHAVAGMQASLHPETYAQVMAGNIPAHVDSPYFVLFWHLQMAATRWCAANGYPDEQIQFVFDDQSELGRAAAEWHDAVVRGIPENAAAMLANAPQFAHDREIMPLKAADIAAWTIHRLNLEARRPAGNNIPQRPLYPAVLLGQIPAFSSILDRDTMLKLVDILRNA